MALLIAVSICKVNIFLVTLHKSNNKSIFETEVTSHELSVRDSQSESKKNDFGKHLLLLFKFVYVFPSPVCFNLFGSSQTLCCLNRGWVGMGDTCLRCWGTLHRDSGLIDTHTHIVGLREYLCTLLLVPCEVPVTRQGQSNQHRKISSSHVLPRPLDPHRLREKTMLCPSCSSLNHTFFNIKIVMTFLTRQKEYKTRQNKTILTTF